MTSSSYSSQSTRPTGRVLWEEILVLSRFHSKLRADFCPLECNVKANTYYGGGGLILQDLGSS